MTFNFVASSSVNAPTPSGDCFSFSAPSPASVEVGAGGGSFSSDAPAPAGGGAPTVGGFAFGVGKAPSVAGILTPAPVGGGLFEGATVVAPSVSSATAAAPPAGGFNFGAPAAAADDKTSTTPPKAPTGEGGLFGGVDASKPSAIPTSTTAGSQLLVGVVAPATADSAKTKTAFNFGPASAVTGGASTKPASGSSASKPAAGGFEFSGASTSATPAPSTTAALVAGAPASKKAETKALPPSVGAGFVFGSVNAAAKDAAKDEGAAATATPVAKSGFSFGAAMTPGTTPAAKAPSPMKTPQTGGGTTSPAIAGGGLFGGATPSASAGVATPSATTPATGVPQSTDKAPPIDHPPIEYQSLTIEQILNRFQSELEADAIAFLNEARRAAHYDATLRNTQHSLSDLTNLVSRLMLHQSEVDAQLTGVGSYQRELSKTLDFLERNVDELFAAQSNTTVEDADIHREKSYERAIDVDSKLEWMDAVLSTVVNDLNAAQERVCSSSGEGKDANEVQKIVGVFNAHHETLVYLEGKAQAVEADLVMINQVLARSGQ